MHDMQTFEYAYLVKELQCLVGKRFSKIYDIARDMLRVKIGTEDLLIHLGKYIHMAKSLPEPEELGNFSQKLRKELDNKIITSIYQSNNDRIIVFAIGEFLLVFEMFSKGNAILVHNGITVACYRNESWKDRATKPGVRYAFPVSSSVSALRECLSARYAVSCLNKLPFGLCYVKHALAACKIEEKKPGHTLTDAEISCLESELGSLAKSPVPYVFYENGKAVDFALARLSAFSHLEAKEHTNLSSAIEACVLDFSDDTPSPDYMKLERRLEKQKELLQQMVQEESDARAVGDFIYAHYQEIEAILTLAKKNDWEQLEKTYGPIVIDRRLKEFEIEVKS